MASAPRGDDRFGYHRYAWLLLRLSALVLVILVLVDVYVVLLADDGVYRIDFNFVALRWSSPFWRTWDLLLLWLALLHGGNGIRTIIAQYARKRPTRTGLTALLALSVVGTLVLGTWAVLTFDANIS